MTSTVCLNIMKIRFYLQRMGFNLWWQSHPRMTWAHRMTELIRKNETFISDVDWPSHSHYQKSLGCDEKDLTQWSSSSAPQSPYSNNVSDSISLYLYAFLFQYIYCLIYLFIFIFIFIVFYCIYIINTQYVIQALRFSNMPVTFNHIFRPPGANLFKSMYCIFIYFFKLTRDIKTCTFLGEM